MPRLYPCLRAIAVAIALPVIALYAGAAMLLHAARSLARTQQAGILHVPLRVWMSLLDWIKGLTVGYSYWEQYQAPLMLDEIAVHHEE